MGKQVKRLFLDDESRRREILAIMTVGGSRRTAAAYVGCSVKTIDRTAERDPAFASQLRRAQYGVEVGYLRNLQKAAKKEQYWRAAAWALERLNPEEFAARRRHVVPLAEVNRLLEGLADFLCKQIESEELRERIVENVRRVLRELQTPRKHSKGRRRDA